MGLFFRGDKTTEKQAVGVNSEQRGRKICLEILSFVSLFFCSLNFLVDNLEINLLLSLNCKINK